MEVSNVEDYGNMTFKAYMAEVDRLLESAVGMGSSCLVDYTYRSMWKDGVNPCITAQEALENEFGTRAPIISEYTLLMESMDY